MLCNEVLGPLTFDASFDSGNCQRVEQLAADEFALWTAPDCQGTEHETGFRCGGGGTHCARCAEDVREVGAAAQRGHRGKVRSACVLSAPAKDSDAPSLALVLGRGEWRHDASDSCTGGVERSVGGARHGRGRWRCQRRQGMTME